MSDLGRLRKVLDFVPAQEMAEWEHRTYYDAVIRRLNREVVVRPVAMAVPADEAVRVVTAQEWDAAIGAQRREMEREQEVEQLRNDLARLDDHRSDLEAEVAQLKEQLSGLETQKREHRLSIVSVRRKAEPAPEPEPEPLPVLEPEPEPTPPLEPAPPVEEPAAPPEPEAPKLPPGWEVVSEPVDWELAEPAPEEATPAAWESVEPTPELIEPEPPEAPIPPPPPKAEAALPDATATDEAINRVEQEIQRIEEELSDLALKEKAIRARIRTPIYRHKGYTLYRRSVGGAGAARDFYFFSRTKPATGEPSPLPAGYTVATNARNKVPFLKKGGAAKRKARKKKT